MKITVNGQKRHTKAAADTPLLYVLRNDCSLVAPKFGCGEGHCGACTVLVDGQLVRSCLMPVSSVEKAEITTLEGISVDPILRTLQESFNREQAAQCGYCSNGMILSAKALLDNNPFPSRDQICKWLDGNLCRCGTHVRIIRAVESAAEALNK